MAMYMKSKTRTVFRESYTCNLNQEPNGCSSVNGMEVTKINSIYNISIIFVKAI